LLVNWNRHAERKFGEGTTLVVPQWRLRNAALAAAV
jgi:hypothetical protein